MFLLIIYFSGSYMNNEATFNVYCCDKRIFSPTVSSFNNWSLLFVCSVYTVYSNIKKSWWSSHWAHFPICLSAVLTIRLKIMVELTTMALSSNWVSLSLALYRRLYNSLLLLQSAGSNSDFLSLLRGWRWKWEGQTAKETGINGA